MKTESRPGGIEGIVLDAVGTLIKPHPPAAKVYTLTAHRQGVRLSLPVVIGRFRLHLREDEGDEGRESMVTDEAAEVLRWRRIVSRVLPELPDPERGFADLWAHFARPQAWRCYPDVAPTLAALRVRGLPVRVASNFDARLRGVLQGLRPLSGLAATAVISSEVGFRKPHPSFYEAACASLGLDAARVLFIGDDPENDVAGAVRAGINALRIDRSRESIDALWSLTDLPFCLRDLAGAGPTKDSDPAGCGDEAPRADEDVGS